MKDNYVADIGDYGKYALLRHLTGTGEDGTAPPALGVVWYLTEHTEENNDGRHTRYLEDRDAYRALDPVLFDHLTDIIARARHHAVRDDGTPTPRSVAEVERRGILPPGTRFAAAPVAGRGCPVATRAECRAAWWAAAASAVRGADVVFLDPDNGLFPDGMTTRRINADKSAAPHEVAHLLGRGQAVVLYHHLDRTKGGWPVRRAQILRAIRDAAGPAADRVSVLRIAAFSSRAFILITPPGHRFADRLHVRHEGFVQLADGVKGMHGRVHIDEVGVSHPA